MDEKIYEYISTYGCYASVDNSIYLAYELSIYDIEVRVCVSYLQVNEKKLADTWERERNSSYYRVVKKYNKDM